MTTRSVTVRSPFFPARNERGHRLRGGRGSRDEAARRIERRASSMRPCRRHWPMTAVISQHGSRAPRLGLERVWITRQAGCLTNSIGFAGVAGPSPLEVFSWHACDSSLGGRHAPLVVICAVIRCWPACSSPPVLRPVRCSSAISSDSKRHSLSFANRSSGRRAGEFASDRRDGFPDRRVVE